jgi:hypothetical protein
MELFSIFVIWLVLGAATAYIANQKGRDPLLWSMMILLLSLFGLPFAVIGLTLLYFLPNIDESEEGVSELDAEDVLPAPILHKGSREFFERQWFFYDDARQQHGPMFFQDLQVAWNEGRLRPDSFVWNDSMDAWRFVKDVPELMLALQGDFNNAD